VVLNFLHCRVADASAIAALEAACKAYLDLGISVRLRHLSADARLILRETTQGAVLEERDADPQYDVAASTPVAIKPSQLQANRAPREETIVVRPAE